MPHHDLTSVPGNGYLVFPLSMSRLASALKPADIYDFLLFFESKLQVRSVDIVFLYTNDLYLNSDDSSLTLRRKILNQVIDHKGAFESQLHKNRHFIPGAFHYLPWDYAILNSPDFHGAKSKLLQVKEKDDRFSACLLSDIEAANRPPTEANLAFLIEELVVSHFLMEKQIPLPATLASGDGWRLICYPGDPPKSLAYLCKAGLLGHRTDLSHQHQLFARSFYQMATRTLIDFFRTE